MSKDMTLGAGRTRWRRFALAAVPAAVAGAVLFVLEAQGAIPLSVTVSGLPATITARQMVGHGLAQYGWITQTKPNPNATPPIPAAIPVVRTALKDATLYDLCQSVTIPLPALVGGDVTLVIKAGKDNAHPVTADNLFIDMTHLSGDASFKNIEIGNDASTLSKGPNANGAQNMFGQQADMLTVDHLSQTAYFTSADTFTLPGMSLDVVHGGTTCTAP
jgi:hypothetical protein